MLGLTEAGSVVLISGDESDQPEAAAWVVRQAGTRIPDQDRRPRLGRESANCASAGRIVMQGYHKRSREECFDADGWFHTGDLVRTDDDGFVYFVGRLSAMIKTAGANVSAAEVEKAIAKVAGTEAHVVGVPDAERGELVAAVLVVRRRWTKPRCVSDSRTNCRRTKSPGDSSACPAPRCRCCPAARSTPGN